MERSLTLLRFFSIVTCAVIANSWVSADEPAIFHKPLRLQADGMDIDTGEAWGHSGPSLADVDGDGQRDLVVGDFSGKFRFYKNVGSEKEPKYAALKFVQAGNTDAHVPIYCCIGSSPHFVDFDYDGILDFISGSYDPGECYLFRGLGGGKFAERQTLLDRSGKPILRHPDQKQNVQSFGSWPVMVDWNNDGKPDLLIGDFEGMMFVRLNEGAREKPEFSKSNIVVQAAGKDLKLPGNPAGHAAPAVADWDGDGRWDILSGCDNGGVYFYRNIGEPEAPRFEEPQVLIAPHEGNGYDEILEVGAEPVPGVRTQIAAVDYLGNGKTDLLVGDFCTTVTPQANLTPAERQEFQSLRKQSEETSAGMRKQMDDLRRDFFKRFPGDAINSDEADAEWTKAYHAMKDSQQYKTLETKSKELDAAMVKYLVKPPRKGSFNEYSTTHGYVWLFLRK
jgi:hypothetical protein